MIPQVLEKSSRKPLRLPIHPSASVSQINVSRTMAGFGAYETLEESVGKIVMSSILPDIHRWIRAIYLGAGSSIGLRRLLSQVYEWCLNSS